MSDYKDITYTVGPNAVQITINRPEVFNAFRTQTVEASALDATSGHLHTGHIGYFSMCERAHAM